MANTSTESSGGSRSRLSVAICDDEEAQLAYLQALVARWADASGYSLSIRCFPSGESFYFCWCEDRSFDILLLDIQMKGVSGMELAKKIRLQDPEIPIVFITGDSDYIGQGYDVDALHYLIKPVTQEKLGAVLTKACARLAKKEPSLLFSLPGELLCVPISDILYLEAQGRTTCLHTVRGTQSLHTGIGELETQLPDGHFFRIHRSLLVNLGWIRRMTHTQAELHNGELLPLSRRLYQDASAAFVEYLKLP